jgi:hypothetical protein
MGSIGGARAMTVQELAGAIGKPDVPVQYVVREHNDQQLEAAVTAPVPVIDFSRLFEQDGGEAVKLRSGLDSWGLILVSNNVPDVEGRSSMHALCRPLSVCAPAGQ